MEAPPAAMNDEARAALRKKRSVPIDLRRSMTSRPKGGESCRGAAVCVSRLDRGALPRPSAGSNSVYGKIATFFYDVGPDVAYAGDVFSFRTEALYGSPHVAKKSGLRRHRIPEFGIESLRRRRFVCPELEFSR